MFRPAPRKALRSAAGVLLRIAGAFVAFAMLITAVTWGAHGLILLIRVIP